MRMIYDLDRGVSYPDMKEASVRLEGLAESYRELTVVLRMALGDTPLYRTLLNITRDAVDDSVAKERMKKYLDSLVSQVPDVVDKDSAISSLCAQTDVFRAAEDGTVFVDTDALALSLYGEGGSAAESLVNYLMKLRGVDIARLLMKGQEVMGEFLVELGNASGIDSSRLIELLERGRDEKSRWALSVIRELAGSKKSSVPAVFLGEERENSPLPWTESERELFDRLYEEAKEKGFVGENETTPEGKKRSVLKALTSFWSAHVYYTLAHSLSFMKKSFFAAMSVDPLSLIDEILDLLKESAVFYMHSRHGIGRPRYTAFRHEYAPERNGEDVEREINFTSPWR